MSDNEDLLADDLGDQSLADYNLGNEEEDQLLADDYESGSSHNNTHNVPSTIAGYAETEVAVAPHVEYPTVPQEIPFANPVPKKPQRIQYHLQPDTGESVVPNITVEVPNVPDRPTYAPYEPPAYQAEHAVPAAIPAASIESPQIVPSEMPPASTGGGRARFPAERPAGAQRTPVVRDIPDTLDKVVVPRGGFARGRSSWRSPHYHARYAHHTQYRRNNLMNRGNFNQRPSFPPPQAVRPNSPQMRPDIRPNPPPLRPDLPPNIRPDLPPNNRPDLPPNIRPELDLPPGIELRPDLPPELRPDMPPRPEFIPEMRPDMPEMAGPMPNLPMDPSFRPMDRPFRFPNQFRPNMDEPRHFAPRNFEPFPYQRPFRPYPPMREVSPNVNHLPQVTIRHGPPPMALGPPKQEVRMLPVQLPPNLPPGGLQGKKVLINPHFKGNFQPPVEGLSIPAYIPTRIQKSPPLSPTLENKFGPVKDIDDAAERFIAEQRDALARAATRKFERPRRSPQRYVENNTIEIENELARTGPPRRPDDDDLLRRQEEFINANRAGLRRRMRSPSPPPPRRSPSPPPPRREPERPRARLDTQRAPPDEDSEYRRRMREQEALRERVTRAKEARRRKNAAAAIRQGCDRERERLDKERDLPKESKEPTTQKEPTAQKEPTIQKEPEPISIQPDTTKNSPERDDVRKTEREQGDTARVTEKDGQERDKSPVQDEAEVNSTCEGLTPPRAPTPRALTPPLPAPPADRSTDLELETDDLDLILGDIDGILSDDDDSGRFKEKTKPAPAPAAVDLRSKLPPKTTEKKPPRQKIVFEKEERKKKEKSPPPRRTIVTSSTTKTEEPPEKKSKLKEKAETSSKDNKTRQRIIFDQKESKKEKDQSPEQPKPQFSNRRVILQRKVSQQSETSKSVFTRIEVKTDPTKPNPGIFSRAVRTAIGNDKNRIVVNKKEEPQVEYESDSDLDEEKLLQEEELGNLALVTNLPHGMTDTRLKTLAGNDVQNLSLDKEERSAKITFKTTMAAENFKKKFNNKMVAASRLTVTLR